MPTNPKCIYIKVSTLNDAPAPGRDVDDYPEEANVVFLFAAAKVGSAGDFLFTPSTYYPGADVAARQSALNAKVANRRGSGSKVILTIGGAGNNVPVNSPTAVTNFVNAVKAANVQFGGSGTILAIDGIDLNTFELSDEPDQVIYLPQACAALKAYYGPDFLVTAPPAANYVQSVLDRELLAAINAAGALDWIGPQYYDGGGLNSASLIRNQTRFYHDRYDPTGNHGGGFGTPVTGDQVIPLSKIGIGFGIAGVGSEGRVNAANWWTAANAAAAYTAAVGFVSGSVPYQVTLQPKGAFNFAADLDTGFSFTDTVAPIITNNVADGNTCTGIQAMTGVASFTL